MAEAIDRRNFLESTALGGTAVGLGLAASARAESPADGDSAKQKVVVGVMGLSRGKALATTFARRPGVEVKYLCDVDQQRVAAGVKSLASAAGAEAKGITDFRRILDDKSVDALICAAPNHWHAPATILACAAGKHVYVEKPCSHNPREGEVMVAAARKHNRVVQMGTQRRSSPGWIEAIGHLHEGVIGRVYLARCWYHNSRGSIGRGKKGEVPANLDYKLWQGPAPHRDYVSNLVHYNWHWRWHWGNGELGNNGVHTIDLCRWGLNVDFPIRVTSSGGRYRFDDDQETPDTHVVACEFEGNKSLTWQGLSCNRHGSGFVTFYGEKGALAVESGGEYVVYDRNDKVTKQSDRANVGDSDHAANFLAAIRNDKPQALHAEIAEAHKSTLLCHLGNIAHRTGRALRCNPADGHILDDQDAMKHWTREYAAEWKVV